jgi:IS66 C-terminal element
MARLNRVLLDRLGQANAAWLADMLSRIADHKATRIDGLLPWRYAAAAA